MLYLVSQTPCQVLLTHTALSIETILFSKCLYPFDRNIIYSYILHFYFFCIRIVLYIFGIREFDVGFYFSRNITSEINFRDPIEVKYFMYVYIIVHIRMGKQITYFHQFQNLPFPVQRLEEEIDNFLSQLLIVSFSITSVCLCETYTDTVYFSFAKSFYLQKYRKTRNINLKY